MILNSDLAGSLEKSWYDFFLICFLVDLNMNDRGVRKGEKEKRERESNKNM